MKLVQSENLPWDGLVRKENYILVHTTTTPTFEKKQITQKELSEGDDSTACIDSIENYFSSHEIWPTNFCPKLHHHASLNILSN